MCHSAGTKQFVFLFPTASTACIRIHAHLFLGHVHRVQVLVQLGTVLAPHQVSAMRTRFSSTGDKSPEPFRVRSFCVIVGSLWVHLWIDTAYIWTSLAIMCSMSRRLWHSQATDTLH